MAEKEKTAYEVKTENGKLREVRWNEPEDEAHHLDCVHLEVPLKPGTLAQQLRAELHLKSVQIWNLETKETVLDETFAEEGWLSIDDSYWEFDPEGPTLKYFLLKNSNFQQEPLYCLFDSELHGPGAEELERLQEEMGESEDEEDDSQLKRSEQKSKGGYVNTKEVNKMDTKESSCKLEQDKKPLLKKGFLIQKKSEKVHVEEGDQTSNISVSDAWLPWVIRHGASAAGQQQLLCTEKLRVEVILDGPGDNEYDMEFAGFLLAGAPAVEVSVLVGASDAPTKSIGSKVPGLTVQYVRGSYEEYQEKTEPAQIAFLSGTAFEQRYYSCVKTARALAERGTFTVVVQRTEMCKADEVSTSMDTIEVILQHFGCAIAVSASSVATPFSQTCSFVCFHGLSDKVPAPGPDLAHQLYLPIRRALAASRVDFRPLYPQPPPFGVAKEAAPKSAADGARHAWLASGSSPAEAAAAAAVTAGIVAIASEGEVASVYGIALTVSCAIAAMRDGTGGVEWQAAGVAAWIGMLHGLFAWDPRKPLIQHGAEVANVVGMVLLKEGIWKSFPEDIQRRKIRELICAGGLKRSGECTIALCQALMGENRPKGASRLVGALNVLKAVFNILMAQASLPNLLDPNSVEIKRLCGVVLESLDIGTLEQYLAKGTHFDSDG